ncbi:oxidoreductase [Priestia koreensis]|uniref:oxidoreductase n=1 Tax=Priestia koreensis TaxID=284581 RepID=UPI001F5A39AA|nr:oxidoreductase [Priestia koreensis]UNL86306.1 oxidoreductase [Priestia koreensis]
MDKVKVGLVGYGFSGQTFHAPLLKALSEFEITKVMSSNPERVREDLGDVDVVSSIEGVLEDESIELVVITTPNTFHFDMAKKSLQANKHVVIEKPMVVESEEGLELIELAEKHDRMLSVYQNRRFDNDFLTIKKLLSEDQLGEVYSYESHFNRFRPEVRDRWRERPGKGAGMLYDLGSHLVDQALHLFGKPNFVQADVFPQRDGSEVDDYFHITLGYDKLRVMLHSGSVVLEAGPRYQVHGRKGSFLKYGMDGQEDALKAGKNVQDDDWGTDLPERYGKLVTESESGVKEERVETVPGSYPTYYKEVYAHLREGKPNPVPAQEGLLTIQILEAAKRSSEEKRVIDL